MSAQVAEFPPQRGRPPKTVPEGLPANAIATAAAEGHLPLLKAMRMRLAAELDRGVPAREVATITRQLRELSREIEGLEVAEEPDATDQAAQTQDEPFS